MQNCLLLDHQYIARMSWVAIDTCVTNSYENIVISRYFNETKLKGKKQSIFKKFSLIRLSFLRFFRFYTLDASSLLRLDGGEREEAKETYAMLSLKKNNIAHYSYEIKLKCRGALGRSCARRSVPRLIRGRIRKTIARQHTRITTDKSEISTRGVMPDCPEETMVTRGAPCIIS